MATGKKWNRSGKNKPDWYTHPTTGKLTYWTGTKWSFKGPNKINLVGAAEMRAGQARRAVARGAKSLLERFAGTDDKPEEKVTGSNKERQAQIDKNDKDRRNMSPSQFFGTNQYGDKRNSEPDKGDKGGDKTPPAPQLSARQQEVQSIRKDKSLSSMDKWVKANRKMIESVGTKRQREMLADYKKRQTKTKSKADGKVGDFSSKRTGNIA